MVEALRRHYSGRLFFKRLVGDLGNFANGLDVKEKQRALMPQVLSVPCSDAQNGIYTLFYEQAGRALPPGHYLSFCGERGPPLPRPCCPLLPCGGS